MRTTRRTRADADQPNALRADHVILIAGARPVRRRYLLASSAPGPIVARPLDPPVDGWPDLLTAQWQEDGSGYRVELRLPRAPASRALGIGVFDAASGGDPMALRTRVL